MHGRVYSKSEECRETNTDIAKYFAETITWRYAVVLADLFVDRRAK
jgi:hypothetical protein